MDSHKSYDENAFINAIKINYTNKDLPKEVIRKTSFMKKHKMKKSDEDAKKTSR